MTKYISNHPFIFLISLVIVASCCAGGFLAFVQPGTGPIDVSAPATETAKAHIQTEMGETPSIEAFNPTVTPIAEVAVPTITLWGTYPCKKKTVTMVTSQFLEGRGELKGRRIP
jgi:hypothetical protein